MNTKLFEKRAPIKWLSFVPWMRCAMNRKWISSTAAQTQKQIASGRQFVAHQQQHITHSNSIHSSLSCKLCISIHEQRNIETGLDNVWSAKKIFQLIDCNYRMSFSESSRHWRTFFHTVCPLSGQDEFFRQFPIELQLGRRVDVGVVVRITY